MDFFHADIILNFLPRAAYFASRSDPPVAPPMKSHPLPLLLQQASNPETVAHVLKVAVAVIRHINPNQTPVVETDQPLYTVAKKLQWKFITSDFAEGKLLVSLGALHIEKMLWHASGIFHEGSGVTTAFANSGIANTGMAQSFLICSNITRTRHYKQKWVIALEMLKRRAYNKYLERFADCEIVVATIGDIASPSSDGEVKSVAEQDGSLQKTATEDDTSKSGTGGGTVQTMIDEDIITEAAGAITEEDRPEPVAAGCFPLNMDVWLKKLCEAQPQADYFTKCQELDLSILEVSILHAIVLIKFH